MIRLVVNADDFGLHPKIDEGILRAHREGIVTSATLLSTGPHAAEAVRAANQAGLALGVHLCLATALPCAAPPEDVAALAPGGRFRSNWAALLKARALGQVPTNQVRTELTAQIARASALGAAIDHLDAHQHLHLLPGVRPVVEQIARELKLPLRWPRERPRPEWLRRPGPALKSLLLTALGTLPSAAGPQRVRAIGLFEAGALDLKTLTALLERLPEGDYELGCHPGEAPGRIPEDPRWTYGWTQELAALTHPSIRSLLARRYIQLVTYRALAA